MASIIKNSTNKQESPMFMNQNLTGTRKRNSRAQRECQKKRTLNFWLFLLNFRGILSGVIVYPALNNLMFSAEYGQYRTLA